MAKNDKKDVLNDLSRQSSQLVFGTDGSLEREDEAIENVVRQTIIGAKTKFGAKTNGQPINYFNEVTFGSAFREILGKDKNSDNDNKLKDLSSFKDYMTKEGAIDISAVLMADTDRLVSINNYKIMRTHIPECAAALEAYKVNIMSPDDFTKMIFNVKFKSALKPEVEKHIRDQIDDLKVRYDIETLSDEIIGDTLTTGESYVAVLSLENELSSMLDDPLIRGQKVLNEEDAGLLDPTKIDVPILTEDVKLNETETEAFVEAFSDLGIENIDEHKMSYAIAKILNENVVIGSKKELLIERAQADIDYANKGDVFGLLGGTGLGKDKQANKLNNTDSRPMYINGSSLRKLEPERVVELKIDNICYGYYYAEDTGNIVGQANYFGPQTGRETNQNVNIAANNTVSSVNGSTSYSPGTTANLLGVSEQKLKVISDVFVNNLAKKVDKPFIRKNKKFKDFIYSLVRQNYIIKKGLKLTYFAPQEVIKFECPSIYRRVTFFAKLYLSILTDNILVKLGRAHDKRIFYINVGADANYEQAVQSVIQDIKTKDYKMDSLSDFNTILSLNPGRWDDYFMPVIGGDRPIEIETAPGMDTDMNSEFMEYLKNSMMTGMGVPRNLIDATADMDFARSVSAQNANFVRDIIKYQKLFTEPFQRLIRQLYRNEYRYNGNSESNVEQFVAIDNIEVYFNSPAALNMSNISEQISVVDTNADFIASQILVPNPDGSDEETRMKLKAKIVKDLMPGIDWDKYQDMYEELKLNIEEEKSHKPAHAADPMTDPYGQPY